jgi:hypothetical protein
MDNTRNYPEPQGKLDGGLTRALKIKTCKFWFFPQTPKVSISRLIIRYTYFSQAPLQLGIKDLSPYNFY